MDEKFSINFEKDGIFLVVNPDSSETLAEIVSVLAEKGVKQYNGSAVKGAVDGKTGRPIRIAEPQEEQAQEADFRMRTSSDGLTCEMWYIPESGGAPRPTVQQVEGYMNSHSVTMGHDEEAIRKMLETPILRQWVVTARGVPAENGKDAMIEYKVDLNVLKPRVVGDHVDMKELGAVINVIQGQEIAEKIPAIAGVDGSLLNGKRIAAYNGKDKSLPTGKGITLSEDRLHIYAEYDGNLCLKGGRMEINPVFEVRNDVDYGVGNIDFIGPVIIHGSVREGFDVRSGNNIDVDGVVEGAVLESKGDITIKGGISGTGKARIKASGIIGAKYIDQAYVRSDSNVLVAEAMMHSDVAARGEITVAGSKKGQIVGGRVQAGSEITCEVLGSEMGTKTEVMVGELPEVIEERRRVEDTVHQITSQIDKVDANLKFLKDMQARGQLSKDKQTMLAKATKIKFQLKAQLEFMTKKLEELEILKEKTKTEGCVRVKNVCYPGVTIKIRGQKYIVREELKFARFVFEDGEIKLKSYD